MPKRIQRRRTKGWRMAEGAVYVGRPTKWGNPFRWWSTAGPEIVNERSRAGCAHAFRRLLDERQRGIHSALGDQYPSDEEIVRELRGKDLACWCPLGEPCHADTLLAIANCWAHRKLTHADPA